MKKIVLAIAIFAIAATASADFMSYSIGTIVEINSLDIAIIQLGDEIFGIKNDGQLSPGDTVLVSFRNVNRTYECACGDGGDLMELFDMTVKKIR